MTEHTPTPWGHYGTRDETGALRMQITAVGKTVAHLYCAKQTEAEDTANAAFIVRAVNVHAEMLAALMVARGLVAEVTHRERGRLKLVAATLDAAIAKAEGRS